MIQPVPITPHSLGPDSPLSGDMPAINRIQTLRVMMKSIELYSRALHAAHIKFQEALSAQDTELKQTVQAARQRVQEAKGHLHPIETLVHLGPTKVAHIASCVNRVLIKIDQIDRVSRTLIESEQARHVDRALAALAMACPRTSYELENNLGGPIKQAQENIVQSVLSSDALTA